MKLSRVCFSICLAIAAPNVYAFTDGSGYQILAQMIKQVGITEEQLSQLEERVKQAKKYQGQFEDYQKAFEEFKKLDADRAKATEMIRNGDLDLVFKRTSRSLTKILNLSGLYDGDIDIEQVLIERISMLKNQRENESDLVVVAKLDNDIQALENQVTIEGLRKVAQKSMGRMAKDESVDESARVTAENTAVIARLAVEQQQEANNRQKSETNEILKRANETLSVGKAYKKMGELRNWGTN
ncbi:hypothetical protein [Ferrimonas kyonanensis]|uniref:hypothetical protein n=1 Tax=Ferrimonas kyonanensis TaxID=364763 RepID=UPI0004816152|nr:hypothetical protein [Ferrimonas kyonanensis]